MKAKFLYANCCTAFYLSDGDWSTDYCSEILSSQDFFLFYYEAHNQIYCGICNISCFRELCLQNQLPFESFKGWISSNYELDIVILINWCSKFHIDLKRIHSKRVIHLNGSAKYCSDSGCSNTSS
jgi:hypothetical protein